MLGSEKKEGVTSTKKLTLNSSNQKDLDDVTPSHEIKERC